MRPVSASQILRFKDGEFHSEEDLLVAEEPLEIRVQIGPGEDRAEKRLSVTMRTPGHDLELAAGFLLTEGILSGPHELLHVRHCETVEREEERGNVVKAVLAEDVPWEPSKVERNFYTTSSCGVCGKTSLEAVKVRSCHVVLPNVPQVTSATLLALSAAALEGQTVFRHTGGIHAAALFDASGSLALMREDVGRHNAVDKVIGAMALQGRFPLSDSILFVSGRAGFELVQKAAVAGIPIMAAVGAPSDLAVKLAEESGITLIGFLRNGRFNVYSHPSRVTR